MALLDFGSFASRFTSVAKPFPLKHSAVFSQYSYKQIWQGFLALHSPTLM